MVDRFGTIDVTTKITISLLTGSPPRVSAANHGRPTRQEHCHAMDAMGFQKKGYLEEGSALPGLKTPRDSGSNDRHSQEQPLLM